MMDEGRLQAHLFGIKTAKTDIKNTNGIVAVLYWWLVVDFTPPQAPKNLKVKYYHPRISQVKLKTQLSNELWVSAEQGMTICMKAMTFHHHDDKLP